MRHSAALLVVFLTLAGAAGALAAPDYTPRTPQLLQLGPAASPKAILDAFVGIPYRSDGAVDTAGRFVLFADPAVQFQTPGLNCSGFVVAALRLLLREPLGLEQAKHDRLGDSHRGAPLGEDWDFGWDLVLNLAQGRNPTLLLPQGALPLDAATLHGHDGRSLRGFDLSEPGSWLAALAHASPGTVVLASMSKPWDKQGYSLLHHHVGLLLPLANGELWFYHALGKAGVECVPLHNADGLARLIRAFPAGSLGPRMVLLIGVSLPR